MSVHISIWSALQILVLARSLNIVSSIKTYRGGSNGSGNGFVAIKSAISLSFAKSQSDNPQLRSTGVLVGLSRRRWLIVQWCLMTSSWAKRQFLALIVIVVKVNISGGADML